MYKKWDFNLVDFPCLNHLLKKQFNLTKFQNGDGAAPLNELSVCTEVICSSLTKEIVGLFAGKGGDFLK